MTKRSRRVLWLALFSGAFGLAMSAQVAFLVPLRARELGASFDVIGLIIGAGALVPALLSVPMGSVIDRLGPRNSFILGASSTAVLLALYVFVTNYWWFIVLQLFVGFGRNLGWVASQSYVTSLSGPEERARLTGRFSFFSNGGQMLAPVLVGGVAQLVGFQWAFLMLAGYAGLFGLVGFLLVDTRAEDHAITRKRQGTGFRSALELVVIRGIQVALLLTFARLWITGVYKTFLPVFLVDTGIEPGVVGTVMATSGFVATGLGPTAGWWARRLREPTVVAVGLGCGALGLVLTPHLAALPLVYIVPVLVGIGQGLSLPLLVSIVTSAAPDDKRGVALGLRSMINQTAGTAAPVVIGAMIAGLGMVLGFTAGALVAGSMLLGSRVLHAIDKREAADAA